MQGLKSRAISVIVAACASAAALAQGGAKANVFSTLLEQLVELTQRKYDGEKRKAACHAVSSILCNFGAKELGATLVEDANKFFPKCRQERQQVRRCTVQAVCHPSHGCGVEDTV